MHVRNSIIIRFVLVILLWIGLMPLAGQARVFLETEVVSGTITAVQDHAVELDGNGVFYYPANKEIKMNLKPGRVVTLRYYVDQSGQPVRKYVEYAAGKNKLAPKTPPTIKRIPK